MWCMYILAVCVYVLCECVWVCTTSLFEVYTNLHSMHISVCATVEFVGTSCMGKENGCSISY